MDLIQAVQVAAGIATIVSAMVGLAALVIAIRKSTRHDDEPPKQSP